MPTPTAITDLSQTASSNYPAGSDSPATLDDVQRAHASFIALLRDGKGQSTPVTLASASTTDIGAQNSTFVEISGTTTITSFGTNYTGVRFLRFAAALTLTHNGSSLILPTGANITTAANDTAIAVPAQSGSGWAVISYMKANGSALVASTNFLDTTRIDVASATTVNLTADAPNTRHINITGTTSITGFTVAAGLAYFVRFNAALTLTNNAAIITQTGANITTAAGDTCLLRATASNTVEVMFYTGAATLATESAAGIVELASSAEALALTATDRAISPARLKDSFSVTGSAPMFACRAWVNFNGTGTVAIRASGNVTSITDNGTGDYTVNFTTAMPDANYAAVVSNGAASPAVSPFVYCSGFSTSESPTTSAFRVIFANHSSGVKADPTHVLASIFR